jgi:hypothetical protein
MEVSGKLHHCYVMDRRLGGSVWTGPNTGEKHNNNIYEVEAAIHGTVQCNSACNHVVFSHVKIKSVASLKTILTYYRCR